jgi:Xaa-Pro aminopeptidase
MREAGAEGASFPIIVAAGPNSAKPHAVPENDRLNRGARPAGLGARAQMATVPTFHAPLSSDPADTQFKKSTRSYAKHRPPPSPPFIPVPTGQVPWTGLPDSVIENAGFGDNFGHSLGHGTGLCIHEAPRLSPHSEDTLAAGMIVTVEPVFTFPRGAAFVWKTKSSLPRTGSLFSTAST